MDKTTQHLHKYPVADTPDGPIYLVYNKESRWFGVVSPRPEIPADYIGAVGVGILMIERELFDTTTTRKGEGE